jgi:hypothetical protein
MAEKIKTLSNDARETVEGLLPAVAAMIGAASTIDVAA